MSVEHRTLRTEREYAHPVSRVFAAWADADIKRQWFTLSGSDGSDWHSDFRVGRTEYYRSPPGATPRVSYDARFYDIVVDERIIISAEVTVDGRTTSVTLSTAEFSETSLGTRLEITEQLALLDGLEEAESRTGGTVTQLKNLAAWLDANRPSAG